MDPPSGTGSGKQGHAAPPDVRIGSSFLPRIELGGEAPADESAVKASKASASHGFTPSPSIKIGN